MLPVWKHVFNVLIEWDLISKLMYFLIFSDKRLQLFQQCSLIGTIRKTFSTDRVGSRKKFDIFLLDFSHGMNGLHNIVSLRRSFERLSQPTEKKQSQNWKQNILWNYWYIFNNLCSIHEYHCYLCRKQRCSNLSCGVTRNLSDRLHSFTFTSHSYSSISNVRTG